MFNKIGKFFASIYSYFHNLWLKSKPVILALMGSALDALKPVLAKKIEETKEDFKPKEIADYIIDYAVVQAGVIFKNSAVIKRLIIGLLNGFKPKVVEILQAKEDGIDSEELASDVIDRIYIDIKKRL